MSHLFNLGVSRRDASKRCRTVALEDWSKHFHVSEWSSLICTAKRDTLKQLQLYVQWKRITQSIDSEGLNNNLQQNFQIFSWKHFLKQPNLWISFWLTALHFLCWSHAKSLIYIYVCGLYCEHIQQGMNTFARQYKFTRLNTQKKQLITIPFPYRSGHVRSLQQQGMRACSPNQQRHSVIHLIAGCLYYNYNRFTHDKKTTSLSFHLMGCSPSPCSWDKRSVQWGGTSQVPTSCRCW